MNIHTVINMNIHMTSMWIFLMNKCINIEMHILWKFLQTFIWSNIMRMHIGLKICHFLQSVVSITKGPKNKIMRISGINSCVPCWDSTLEQFLFYRVSGKNAKSDFFWSHSYSKIHLSKQHFCHKREAPRNIIFFNIFGHLAKQNLFQSTVPNGQRIWNVA